MKRFYTLFFTLCLLGSFSVVQAGSAGPAPKLPESFKEVLKMSPEQQRQLRKELRSEVREWRTEQKETGKKFRDVDPEVRSAILLMGIGLLGYVVATVVTLAIAVGTGSSVATNLIGRLLYLASSAVFIWGLVKLIMYLAENA